MEARKLQSKDSVRWTVRCFSRAWLLTIVLLSNFTSISFAVNNSTTVAPSTQVPNITIFKCDWQDLTFPIALGPAIACSLAVILGGFELFVGFKYFRTSLFLTGLGGGALLTYFICIERSSLSTLYILLITGAVSIFIGILCTTVQFCGQFTCGLAAGFCISMAFLLGFASLFPGYNTISIPIGIMISISVAFAGIAVWWKRALIVMSSIFGGALIASGLDYFVEDMWLCRYSLKKIFLVTTGGELCLVSWLIGGMWPLLAVIGLLVQFLKTAKKPAKPRKDIYDKRYTTGSPFYSAPEDMEMAELIPQSTTTPSENACNETAHLNAEETL